MTKKLAITRKTNSPEELAVSVRRGGAVANVGRWQAKFLDELRQIPSVKHAAISSGVNPRTAYRERERDPEFARRWEEAIERSIDDVEAKVFKMALNGNDQVAANLCTWLLRCHRPERYDPVNRTELAVAGGIIFIPQKLDGAE